MKRVLPAALALTMAMSAVPAFADTEDRPLLISPNPMAKSDVIGTEYEEAVKKLLADGVVSGYSDGSFKPENPITRAEVCAMLIKAGGSVDAGESEVAIEAAFSDLDKAPWAKSFILEAAEAGIVSGYKDGTFKPANNISYNELASMLVKAAGVKSGDIVGGWPEGFVAKAKELGAPMKAGDALATRGDVAVAIYNAQDEIEAAAKAGYVKEVENQVSDKEEGLGYQVSNATEEFTGTPLVLSLEEAVTKMQTESVQAETAQLNKKGDQAKAQGYGDAASAMREALDLMDLGEKFGMVSLGDLYEAQEQGVTETNEEILKLQRDFAKAHIEDNYQTELNSIRLSTIQTYYGLLQANDALRIQEENLAVQQDLLKLTQMKYDLGTVSKIDLLTAKNAVITAESDVISAKNMVAQAKMGVNMLLEQPLMQELQLTTRYEALALPTITLTEAINSAMDQRNELVAAEFSEKVMRVNFTSIRYRYGTQSTKYKEAEVQMKQVEQLCAMMPKNVEMDIRTRYADVHAKHQAVQAAQNTLDFAKEGFRISQITYNAGMNTISDVHQAQVGVLGAELGLSSAIASYNQAVYEFEVAVGAGTERISF
ncbi:MAG: S-layer homology domain-containing protein [Firmicutes bacterium]|nr:S-layer homology domain-containing protein [Bacillota bacterium]